ncbi:unnamed protein product, partial [Durusdinium trenchii]
MSSRATDNFQPPACSTTTKTVERNRDAWFHGARRTASTQALRKELRDERCRLQNFSYKLKATEDELFRKKAQVDPGKLRVPSLPLDFMKPRAIEHFNLTCPGW